ncbi:MULTISPECIES: glycosyltransferase [unclassified Pantoea]|uniref:glycosyltransferase n=1 Tax=unclassified Pantoea TaxID=2630326 RepID=UPI001CD6DDAE|nr:MULTISPECIES: glycosyltransferase [unclassified Pantoea]MCA1176226.1 glycosyltransferase [Pantoea sp. alder69]MCA1249196.1 glycosyltransferase [Pantoea sp. alder70]MCA1264729.1 glycosyltransferase [Pantoea sp. alder81]
MKILIDLQGAQTESRFRGIGRYSLSITKGLLRNNKYHDFYVLLNGNFEETIEDIKTVLDGLLPEKNILVCQLPTPLRACDEGNEWRQSAAAIIREEMIRTLSVDWVFITSLFEGHIDDATLTIKKLQSNTKVAVLHHDLIPLVNEKTYLQDGQFRQYYMKKIECLKMADLILTNSDYTAQETHEYLPDASGEIVSISSATEDMWYDKEIVDINIEAVREKFSIRKDIILYAPGGFDKRKNFERLIVAFSEIEPELRFNKQLVIISKVNEADRNYLQSIVKNAGLLKSDVILTGYVSDDELILLYRNCFLFVFASEHEGFGLPILEAMRCGAPTIGSNVTSIPEVIGLEEALFDPFSVKSISSKIREVIINDQFRHSLKNHALSQASKFSWDISAQRALDAFEHFKSEIVLTVENTRESISALDSLKRISTKVRPTDQDLLRVAEALDRNIKRVELNNALVEPLQWQVDGPFDSSYSLALVNREFARGLARKGVEIRLHSTEGPGDFSPDISFMQKAANADLLAWNEKAVRERAVSVSIQSRNIYPPRVSGLNSKVKLLHCYAWEETGYPLEWIHNFNQELDAVLCTSHHVKKVLIDNGLRIPAIVTGNGCDHWESVNAKHYSLGTDKTLRFLHVSSCFPRKGAEAMLEAFGQAFSLEDDVTLIIKTFDNPHNTISESLTAWQKKNPDFPQVVIIKEDLDEGSLKSIYEQCDVLVAPSCAEGFGLPIAEAMLSGMPAIVTDWSGQKDFCDSTNSWLVDYDYAHAKTHFGLYSSAWVNIDVDDLARKMKLAALTPADKRSEMAKNGREKILSDFTWSAVAERSVSAIHTLETKNWELNQKAKIGWITTWNTKCGIATYSQHLIDNMSGINPVIFSPNGQELLDIKNDSSIRSWSIGKENNDFDAILKHIMQAGINTIIIQFNYGFFNHAELSELIYALKQKNIVVVMTLHSTVDPEKKPEQNFKLVHMIDALKCCDRLLVHSFADMNRLKSLGLENNVTLFPHGVLSNKRLSIKHQTKKNMHVIASYGFCLPHKGLSEIVEAVKILRDQKVPVKLKLVNAEFPVGESRDLIHKLKQYVNDNNIGDLVEFHNSFLSDDESLNLLSDADLLLFAYQDTGESASGAVRYGMATSKPVIVTPIPIFNDLGDAVFKFNGFTAKQIAEDIIAGLKEIEGETPKWESVTSAAESWRNQHDYSAVSMRLNNICNGLIRNRAIKDWC